MIRTVEERWALVLGIDPYIRGLVWRLIGSLGHEAFEDGVQVARIAAFNSAETWDPEKGRTIFRSYAHEQIRWDLGHLGEETRKRPRSVDYSHGDADELAESDPEIDDGPTPAQVVREKLDCLNSVDREMVQVHYGVGVDRRLTFQEIAAQRGVTKQAVQNKIARALARVRVVATTSTEEVGMRKVSSPRTVVVHPKRGKRRGVEFRTIDLHVPKDITEFVPDGQKYLVELMEDGRIVYVPVGRPPVEEGA